jgi:hypothetical protein
MSLIIAIAVLCAGDHYPVTQDKCIKKYLECLDKRTGGAPLRVLSEVVEHELMVCIRERVK